VATRNWPLIARVTLVGEVFAHAIARKREHKKLLAALAEIRLLKDRLKRENSYLKQAIQVRPPQRLTSRSPLFLSVVEEIKQVALTSIARTKILPISRSVDVGLGSDQARPYDIGRAQFAEQ
jgi:hypothetical protein